MSEACNRGEDKGQLTRRDAASTPSQQPFPGREVGEPDFYRRGKLFAKEAASHLVSRQMGREHHKSVSKGNLLQRLNQRARENAIIHMEGDGLLSTLVDGIDGGELTEKVIIGLCQVLAEQNRLTPGITDLKVLRANSESLVTRFFPPEETVCDTPVGGIPRKDEKVQISPDGHRVPVSLKPFVVLRMTDFTRRVKGQAEGSKVDSKDRETVRNILSDLRKKTIYTRSGGNWIGATLVGRERLYYDSRTKEEIRVIELDSVFTRGLLNDFITLPFDLLQRLRGRQKKITMRLMWYLVEQRSYHQPTYPMHQVVKVELMGEIAIIEKYKRHPGILEYDLAESVATMKRIRLLSAYEEVEGKSQGSIICRFTFSDDFDRIDES